MRRLAVRFLFLVLILTFGFSASLFANPILYTFRTTSGVDGSFTLDDSIPFILTAQGAVGSSNFHTPTPWFSYHAMSSLISGTYGAYSFSGAGDCCFFSGNLLGLNIDDYQPPYDSAGDHGFLDLWMLRANLSGPELNGRSAIAFSILDYASLGAINGPSYTPPPGIHDPVYFFVTVGFSDGTHESGELESLTLVPEPSSVLLLGFGLVGLIALKRGFPNLKVCTQS